MTDNIFATPALGQAEFESSSANVYLYQFSYKGELGQNMNIPDVPGILTPFIFCLANRLQKYQYVIKRSFDFTIRTGVAPHKVQK